MKPTPTERRALDKARTLDALPLEDAAALAGRSDLLDFARRYDRLRLAETRLVRDVQQVGERADLLSMFQLYFGDAGRLNEEIDRLRSVTPEAIRSFAEDYMRPDNRAILTYLPKPSPSNRAGSAAGETSGSPT